MHSQPMHARTHACTHTHTHNTHRVSGKAKVGHTGAYALTGLIILTHAHINPKIYSYINIIIVRYVLYIAIDSSYYR